MICISLKVFCITFFLFSSSSYYYFDENHIIPSTYVPRAVETGPSLGAGTGVAVGCGHAGSIVLTQLLGAVDDGLFTQGA